MALPGLIPQIQAIAGQILQNEANHILSSDTVSGLIQPNGISIPSSASIQGLLKSVPAITSIVSTVNGIVGTVTSDIKSVEGFLNSVVGTPQQLGGLVSSVVGAASALGLNPSAINQIAQTFSTVNTVLSLGGLVDDFAPIFNHALNTTPSVKKFPFDLPEDGVRIAFAFKEYQKSGPQVAPSYSDPTTIVFPVPNELNESYGVQYSEFSAGPLRSLGLFNDAMTAAGSVGSISDVPDAIGGFNQRFADKITGGNLDQVSTALRAAMYYNVLGSGTLGSVVGKIGQQVSSPTIGSMMNNYFGNIINPSTTVSMTNVPLRHHKFSWMFTPKSKDESDMMQSIIEEIRTFVRPTITNGGFFLEYPHVCFPKIFKGSGSDELYPFKPCFVDNITINHAGSGTPSFFFDSHNPTTYQVMIELHELEMFVNEKTPTGQVDVIEDIETAPDPNDSTPTVNGDDLNILPGLGNNIGIA